MSSQAPLSGLCIARRDLAARVTLARPEVHEARLGLAPAVIAPFVIARIGAGHARALFLTAERFDAAHALAIGLVHRLVPAGGLDAAVEEVLRQVLAGGPEALRARKGLAWLG
jgi:methylglutaconyl-CoA hydratase